MKTFTILLSLLFVFSFRVVHAQYSFGLKGSYTNSWNNSQQGLSSEKVTGIGSSLFLYRSITNHLQIGIEPGFVQRGTTYDPVDLAYLIDCVSIPCSYLIGFATLYSNHVNLPVMAKSNFNLLKGRLDVFAKFGGGPSYFTSGFQTIPDYGYDEIMSVRELNLSENTKSWEWGLNGGIGLGVALGPGTLLLETEYYHGLSAMPYLLNTKSRSLAYSLGYSISL